MNSGVKLHERTRFLSGTQAGGVVPTRPHAPVPKDAGAMVSACALSSCSGTVTILAVMGCFWKLGVQISSISMPACSDDHVRGVMATPKDT